MSEPDYTDGLREDVAYIRAKIEMLPDHENRIRRLEKAMWGLPASIIATVAAFFGFHGTT